MLHLLCDAATDPSLEGCTLGTDPSTHTCLGTNGMYLLDNWQGQLKSSVKLWREAESMGQSRKKAGACLH